MTAHNALRKHRFPLSERRGTRGKWSACDTRAGTKNRVSESVASRSPMIEEDSQDPGSAQQQPSVATKVTKKSAIREHKSGLASSWVAAAVGAPLSLQARSLLCPPPRPLAESPPTPPLSSRGFRAPKIPAPFAQSQRPSTKPAQWPAQWRTVVYGGAARRSQVRRQQDLFVHSLIFSGPSARAGKQCFRASGRTTNPKTVMTALSFPPFSLCGGGGDGREAF